MTIGSSVALIIYTAVMLGTFLFSTWTPNAPFLAFAVQFTLGFIAFISKRLIQKKKEYNGKHEESEYNGETKEEK